MAVLVNPEFMLSVEYWEVGGEASMALISAACWVARACKTDVIPPGCLQHAFSTKRWRSCLARLLEHGLLTEVEGGYVISTEMIRIKRKASAKAKIPSSLRQMVLERDEHCCQHCGTTEKLSIDHIHPESKGGVTALENLQVLCKPCNSRKGSRVDA